MAALCANGGERKLFGGTFGGIFKDVIGKYLYISMYFYCLFCSYYPIKINKLPHIQLHHAFLLCHISAIVTLAISQNTVLTSGSAGADI